MTYLLSFVTKRGSSFGMRVVMYLGGELAYDILLRGSVYFYEGCSEVIIYFFSSFTFTSCIPVL